MDPTAIAAFAASLPKGYRDNFDPLSVAQHARTAMERESAPANVGTFASPRRSEPALCVVADDKPGLLAIISAALVACGLDVIEAEAYTRVRDDQQREALDVFWVRPVAPALRGRELGRDVIEQLKKVLIGLLEGKLDRRRLSDGTRHPPTPGSVETTVRFLETADGDFGTLEVETGDRSGLLLALSQALYEQGVQIIGSQVKTRGQRVFDRFHVVERNGAPIGPERRLAIQVAVISAIDPVELAEEDRPSVA